MKPSERIKDYATVWNEAAASIYLAVSFSIISSYIKVYQNCIELREKYSSLSYGQPINCGLSIEGFDNILLVVMMVVMFIAGISNFFYTRRYFRDGNPKSASGFIATFALAASNIYIVYLLIRSIIQSSELQSVSAISLVSGASWTTWAILIAVIISLITSIIAAINVFTWSPITIDSNEGGEKKTPEFGAFAATHAMGHAAPEASEAPKEKELPPLLNPNPDAPVAQPAGAMDHTIMTDTPVFAQGTDKAPSETPGFTPPNQTPPPGQ